MNITEVLIQPQQIAWLPWAVQYFFYIGSAYAAAILFAIALVFEQYTSHKLRTALGLVLALGAIIGPLALTADLHQPARAWHFFAYFTPWSWMSRGAILLPIFATLAIGTTWLYLRADLQAFANHPKPLRQKIAKLALGNWQTTRQMMLSAAVTTAISGISIAIYTGAEISILASRPLWQQISSPLLWFTTAFSACIGFSLIIWLIFSLNQRAIMSCVDLKLLRLTVIITSITALLLLPIWFSGYNRGNLYDQPFWLGYFFLLALSFITAAATAWRLLQRQYHFFGLVISALTLLISAWLVRWITMMQVQTLAKFDVGPYPYALSFDSNGLIGIIGMLGLWITLAIACAELFSPAQPALTTNQQ